MNIIDAHMHFSDIASFHECGRQTSGVDYSETGFINETQACGITRSVCMGLSEIPPGEFPDPNARTPMTIGLSGQMPPSMALCPGINPHTLTARALDELDVMLSAARDIVGVKIYAGYYHYEVTDPIYDPVYRLAEKHDKTVVIHSGDTYSERGKLIYSQPLSIDSLAVDRPGMRIVICHMGAPWLYDACEVAGKNSNVYMDLSGLHVGNAAYFAERIKDRLLIDRYKQALTVMDKYDKVLFGTDWPLAPMASYIDFCKELVPRDACEMVFYENARRVFKL